MRENWKENHDMDLEDEVVQWIYKDKIIVDKCIDGTYVVNVYYDNDFIYLDYDFKTLQDAMNFVEDVWSISK